MSDAINQNNASIIKLFNTNAGLIQEIVDALKWSIKTELQNQMLIYNHYDSAVGVCEDENVCGVNDDCDKNYDCDDDDDDMDDRKIFNALSPESVVIDVIDDIERRKMWVNNQNSKKLKPKEKQKEKEMVKKSTKINNHHIVTPYAISSSSPSSCFSSLLIPSLSNLLHIIFTCKQLASNICVPFINSLLKLNILRHITNIITLELSSSSLRARKKCAIPKSSHSQKVRKLLVEIVNVLVLLNPIEVKKYMLMENVCLFYF
jgi:hypothetical protein